MKLFDVDWSEVIRALPAWEALPPSPRAAFLGVKPSAGAKEAQLGPWLEPLLKAGLLETGSHRQVRVPDRLRALHVVLRAMHRHRVWDEPTRRVLVQYLEDHFTNEEVASLLGGGAYALAYPSRGELADRASSEEWVERFLDQPGVGEKGIARLVRDLLPFERGVPLRELPARYPEWTPDVLSDALRGGLRRLLLFAALRDDGEPAVGVWPEVAARLARPSGGPPAPVEAAEWFEAAFLMEDMTTVLSAAAAEPLRLKASDLEVFARTRQALAGRLVSIPAWAAEALGAEPDDRVETAAGFLRSLGLAELSDRGDRLSLVPTAAGMRWLEKPDRDRLAALVDPIRRSAERNPRPWHQTEPTLDLFAARLSFQFPASTLDLRAAVERAFLAVPEGSFVAVGAFLDHQVRVENPFVELTRRAGAGALRVPWGPPPSRRDWERVWAEMVTAVLSLRLAPLGAARLGRTADGELCFAVTAVGRYLLGAAEELEYAATPEGGVVVQPNFEVVFLAPAPRVEAQIARFAERTGSRVGTLFRITRGSILAAAEAGFTAERVLETLQAASPREVPGNVQRQLRDWFAATRTVRVRATVLVECPDAETAARVLAAGGGRVRKVTSRLLELTDATRPAHAALVKRLRKEGVFVQG